MHININVENLNAGEFFADQPLFFFGYSLTLHFSLQSAITRLRHVKKLVEINLIKYFKEKHKIK